MLGAYLKFLILTLYIPIGFKGLFTPSWELMERSRALTGGKRIFITFVTVLILFVLKQASFGGEESSALSIGLNLIIGFEVISGTIKCFNDYDEVLYRVSPLLPKIPMTIELIYFCLLALSFFGLTPNLSASHTASAQTAVVSSIPAWNPVDYQKDPQKYVGIANQKLTEQSVEIDQIKSDLDNLSAVFKSSPDTKIAANAYSTDTNALGAQMTHTALLLAINDLTTNPNPPVEKMSDLFKVMQSAEQNISDYRIKISEYKKKTPQ